MNVSIKVTQKVLDIINETEFSSYAYNYIKEITGYISYT